MLQALLLLCLTSAPAQAQQPQTKARPVVGVLLKTEGTYRNGVTEQGRNGLQDALVEAEPNVDWIVVLSEEQLQAVKSDATATIVIERKETMVEDQDSRRRKRVQEFHVVRIETRGQTFARETHVPTNGAFPLMMAVLATGFCCFGCPPAAAGPWTILYVIGGFMTGYWFRPDANLLSPLQVFGCVACGWPFFCVCGKIPLLWPCSGADFLFSEFDTYYNARDPARPVLPELLDEAGLTSEKIKSVETEAI